MTLKTKISNICATFLVLLIYSFGMKHFITWLTGLQWMDSTPDNWLAYFFYTCLCAPIFEELQFRHIPLQATKLIPTTSEAMRLKIIMLTVMATSLWFGNAHGNTWNQILMQGVGGVALSYVYIKNGFSYWSAVALHSFWNFFALFW